MQYCQCDQWTKWNPWTSDTNGSNALGRFCFIRITSWIVLDCLHCLYCFLACFGLSWLLVLLSRLICIVLLVCNASCVVWYYLHCLHLWNSYTFFWNPRIARSAPRSARNTWAKLSATHWWSARIAAPPPPKKKHAPKTFARRSILSRVKGRGKPLLQGRG